MLLPVGMDIYHHKRHSAAPRLLGNGFVPLFFRVMYLAIVLSASGSRKCVVAPLSGVYQLLSKNNYLMTLFSP